MFSLSIHAAVTILTLIAGATFWLADDFIAERNDIEREIDLIERIAPSDTRDRDTRRADYAKTARQTGIWLLCAGGVLAVLFAIRLAL